jgi:hypothetical protein
MSRPKPRKRPVRAPTSPKPDFDDILGQFSDAIAFVECSVKAFEADDRGGPANLVLEHGLAALRAALTGLDRVIAQLE